MKRAIVVLTLFLCSAVTAHAAEWQREWSRGSAPVATTANTATEIKVCEVLCLTAKCVFGLLDYAQWATRPVLDDHLYSLSITTGVYPYTFPNLDYDPKYKVSYTNPLYEVFTGGTYWKDFTGTTERTCTVRK